MQLPKKPQGSITSANNRVAVVAKLKQFAEIVMVALVGAAFLATITPPPIRQAMNGLYQVLTSILLICGVALFCLDKIIFRRVSIVFINGMGMFEALIFSLVVACAAWSALILFGPSANFLILLKLLLTMFWLQTTLWVLELLSQTNPIVIILLQLGLFALWASPVMTALHIATNKQFSGKRKCAWLFLHGISIVLLLPWPAVIYQARWIRWTKPVPLLPDPGEP